MTMSPTTEAARTARLKALRSNAREWAETYVDLVEELVAVGMPEDEAKAEARAAANLAAFLDEPSPEACPGCGKEGGELTSQEDSERQFMCRCGARWTAPFEEGR